VEGELNVTGVLLSGAPFIICGHNDSTAWGMTNVMLDDMDFYLEIINPEDSNQYKFNGEWKNMEIVEEEIMQKDGEIIPRINRFTHRGPVISGFKNTDDVISMRWIGNEFSNEMRACFLLNRMNNWNDFKNATNTFVSISQNVVYGDVAGNIGLYICAGVPMREGNRSLIAPGDTDRYDWKGLVPYDALPHIYNPLKGYVISANNRSTTSDYPYQISEWYDLPSRFNRINEVLKQQDVVDVELTKILQTDQKSKWAEKILKAYLPYLESSEWNEEDQKVLQILKDWDYTFGVDDNQPVIFEVFYNELIEDIFKDEMGEELYREFLIQDLLSSYVTDRITDGQQISWCDNVETGCRRNKAIDLFQEDTLAF